MKKSTRFLLIVFIVVFGSGNTCQPKSEKPRSEPKPKFTSFNVTPNNVCLNVGVDFVRVSYQFDPDGWSNPETLCVDVLANGNPLHNTIHHQCLSDGTKGELSFRLSQFFGSDVPSIINVTANLVPNIAGNIKDTTGAAITTDPDCPPPGFIPNP